MKIKKIILFLAFVISLSSCSKNNNNSNMTEDKNIPSIKKVDTNKDEDSKDDNNEITEQIKENNSQTHSLSDLTKHEKIYYDYFDTITSFTAYTKTEEEFNKYLELLEKAMLRYHEFYNGYNSFEGVNNIKTINENAGKKPVEVDPEIIELINFAKEIYKDTDGKINIAYGSVLELWHNARETFLETGNRDVIPSKEELEEKAKHKDIDKVIVDEKNNTVFIEDPNIKLELGAVNKGFAIKKLGKMLVDAGVKNAILSVGGDDLLIGDNPSRENGMWNIAIKNPDTNSDETFRSIVGLKNTTVVTSGDYQRFFEVDGVRYHHIIDTDTNMPAKYFKSVSVVCDDIALADGLSTYLFTIDLEKGKEICERFGIEAYWIDLDDNEYKTDGWEGLEI